MKNEGFSACISFSLSVLRFQLVTSKPITKGTSDKLKPKELPLQFKELVGNSGRLRSRGIANLSNGVVINSEDLFEQRGKA